MNWSFMPTRYIPRSTAASEYCGLCRMWLHTYIVMARIVVARIVMACIVMACTGTAYMALACVGTAHIVMACIVMVYEVMAYLVMVLHADEIYPPFDGG